MFRTLIFLLFFSLPAFAGDRHPATYNTETGKFYQSASLAKMQARGQGWIVITDYSGVVENGQLIPERYWRHVGDTLVRKSNAEIAQIDADRSAARAKAVRVAANRRKYKREAEIADINASSLTQAEKQEQLNALP